MVKDLVMTIKEDTFEVKVKVNCTSGDYTVSVLKLLQGEARETPENPRQVFTVKSPYNLGDLTVPVETVAQNGSKANSVVQLMQRAPLTYQVVYHGSRFDIQVCSAREQQLKAFMPVKEDTDTSKYLMSPMPGSVVSLSVNPGDTVVVGQELCVIEAMKMQNSLKSPKDGKVRGVRVKKGDTVVLPEYGGMSIKVNDVEMFIYKESEILAIIKD